MAKMKAVQISRGGGDFEVIEKEIPAPGRDEVRIKIEACGVCHSDALVKEGRFPGLEYPRVPGHEVIGRIDAAGTNVSRWKEGERVGVGWHGGHCFHCDPCRHGDFVNCEKEKVTGISFDGGYAEYMVVVQQALAKVPDQLDSAEAAPLLCAGITTFNALRHSGARPGDLVAVTGIGGLGHLALQFSRHMGFRTIALSHSPEKRDLAKELGAHAYIDTGREQAGKRLKEMGGAKVILAVAPSSQVMSDLFEGLGPNGTLMAAGISEEPLQVSPMQLISGRRTIQGWASGDAMDSEETLNFSALSGVKPMVETFPLEKAGEAYGKMMSNQVRFRAVLTMNV